MMSASLPRLVSVNELATFWMVGDTEVIHARLFAKVDLADVTSEPAAQFTCDTVRLLSSDP